MLYEKEIFGIGIQPHGFHRFFVGSAFTGTGGMRYVSNALFHYHFTRRMAREINQLPLLRNFAHERRGAIKMFFVEVNERIVENQKRLLPPREHFVNQRKPQTKRAYGTHARA